MDNPQELAESRPFTAVEFCAGYAGIHIGLKRAIPNLRLLALGEIEAFAAANLVAKMEAGLLDPAPVWSDLKTFPSRTFRGQVGLLVAGFPCQPFSAAGKRNADTDPRHLFPYILDAAVEMEAATLLLENVEGIISAKLQGDGWNDPAGTSVLLHVLRELERMGYVATAGVFSAAEVGAPHQRKRVFILAHKLGAGLQRGEECGGSSEDRTQPHDQQPQRCDGAGRTDRIWPSRPGEQQHCWEPPRVVGTMADLVSGGIDRRTDRDGRGEWEQEEALCSARGGRGQEDGVRQTQPPMGRDADGLTDRLDYAELYSTCDNRTDELRLLGNGVVPDTAERAYRILSKRLRP